jgi:hypothetical protein
VTDKEPKEPRRRRRAVGPPGAKPPVEEPRADVEEDRSPDRDDDERFLRDVPPHHGPV